MAERDTSEDQKIDILETKQSRIRQCLSMIRVSKQMIAAANAAAQRFPSISELASLVVKGEKQTIVDYTNEIRRVRNGG